MKMRLKLKQMILKAKLLKILLKMR